MRPILFLRDGAGGGESGKKKEQCELHEHENLKEELAEASRFAECGVARPAQRRQPSGDGNDPKCAKIRDA